MAVKGPELAEPVEALRSYPTQLVPHAGELASACSWAVLGLMAVESILGLTVPGLYHEQAWARAALRGNDLVTLVLVVPAMALALRFHRGSNRWTLVWLASLFYCVYNYAYYAFGTTFNDVFLLHVATFALSIAALVGLMSHVVLDGSLGRALGSRLNRAIAGFMLLVGGALLTAWGGLSLRFAVTGELPRDVMPPTAVHLVYALDMSLLAPAFIAGGVQLWRRRPWGHVLGVAVNLFGAAYLIVLEFVGGFEANAGIAGKTWVSAPAILGALLCAGAAGALLGQTPESDLRQGRRSGRSRDQRAPRSALTACAGLIALSAYYGSFGLITGMLSLDRTAAHRLPLHSPVLGGVALAVVVALSATWVAVLSLREHPRAREAATLAGLALIGWILVEAVVIRAFSPLQPVCAALGLGLVLMGERRTLRQAGDVARALPLLAMAPIMRHWHTRWGASATEVASRMPGDDLVRSSQLTATRAITIDAPAESVWPWLLQIGYRRAGFYSYDLLDNLGRPSAETILPEWQHLEVGALAAPMAYPPTPDTSFVIAEIDAPSTLVWTKPDSSWTWSLATLPDGGTRLVTRLKQHYRPGPAGLLTIVLAEFGDFPMMRKMLRGIKRRAEALAVAETAQPLCEVGAR